MLHFLPVRLDSCVYLFVWKLAIWFSSCGYIAVESVWDDHHAGAWVSTALCWRQARVSQSKCRYFCCLVVFSIPCSRQLTNAAGRETTSCPPGSRLHFFGHVAQVDSKHLGSLVHCFDHHFIGEDVEHTRVPPGWWEIDADVWWANVKIHSAWRVASDRVLRERNIQYGNATDEGRFHSLCLVPMWSSWLKNRLDLFPVQTLYKALVFVTSSSSSSSLLLLQMNWL